jgi:hypothetical protein
LPYNHINSLYWRERADEARARASEMHGIETKATKATMLQIAKMYDEMAQRAEARERLEKDAEARRGITLARDERRST